MAGAITTYAELQDAIIRFPMRTGDAEFTADATTFIQLAESKLNRELALRVMEVDTGLTGTVGSRLMDLPADYVEPIALHLTTFDEWTELRPDVAGDMPLCMTNGIPDAWCVNGASIQLDTPCDQAHTFTFRYRKSFALSDDEPTNWLLTNHPDLYLAGSLFWGGGYMMAPAQATYWKAVLDEALGEVRWKESRSTLSTLRVDPALAGRGGFNINRG